MVPLVSSLTATVIGLASCGVVVTIGLGIFLISKELSSACDGVRSRRFTRNLDIAIVPLVVVFFSLVIMKVLQVVL